MNTAREARKREEGKAILFEGKGSKPRHWPVLQRVWASLLCAVQMDKVPGGPRLWDNGCVPC